MSTQRVTCRNRSRTERGVGKIWYTDCRGCPFLYTHLSNDGPSSDVVRCDSPLSVKHGDTVEVVPQQVRRVDAGTPP